MEPVTTKPSLPASVGWRFHSRSCGARKVLNQVGLYLLAASCTLAQQTGALAPAATPSTGARGNIAAGSPASSDIPSTFTVPLNGYDYVRREVMIPMRDGVKLHTVIIVPIGARNAPILLTRTPYNASKRTERNSSPHMLATLPQGDEVFVTGGYIRVFQDVRGKYKSEGDYVMTRPVRGPLNPTATDHVTDAYDTIDWLVKNTPESNGRVGMIGSSYEGFTVVMALHGRFILGVGVGWAKQEFQALGVPFEQRGAIANEYLAVIKKCWTNDVVSHDGRYVSFREVHTGPRPVRSPHPPIWVGGRSEAAMRRGRPLR